MKTAILIFFSLNFSLQASLYEKSVNIFDKLNTQTLHLVDEFYAQNAVFIDPLGTHKGVESIRSYYKSVYSGVESIKFNYSKYIEQNGELTLFWNMSVLAPSLKKEKIIIDGVSHIKFDENGKAFFHQDYFDSAALFYKNIPVLKTILKYIDKKIKTSK